MSQIKNTGLDQYGPERFEHHKFGTAGVEGLSSTSAFESNIPTSPKSETAKSSTNFRQLTPFPDFSLTLFEFPTYSCFPGKWSPWIFEPTAKRMSLAAALAYGSLLILILTSLQAVYEQQAVLT